MLKNVKSEVDTKEIFANYLAKCKESDCGRIGKSLEVAIRAYVLPKSKRQGVTPNKTWYGDFSKKFDGKICKFEVKSGCGELGIIEMDGDLDISQLLPKADYVMYAPEVVENISMESQTFVFTRAEFLEMISNYTGRGQLIRSKVVSSGNGYRVAFQSFFSDTRPKASKPIADYIWECCYNMPTVEDWLSEVA